jgi:hypothetical protein
MAIKIYCMSPLFMEKQLWTWNELYFHVRFQILFPVLWHHITLVVDSNVQILFPVFSDYVIHDSVHANMIHYKKYRQPTRCNNNGLLIIPISSTCFGRWFRPKHVELFGIINKPLLLCLVGCLYYLFQWCVVKQISNIKWHSLEGHSREDLMTLRLQTMDRQQSTQFTSVR